MIFYLTKKSLSCTLDRILENIRERIHATEAICRSSKGRRETCSVVFPVAKEINMMKKKKKNKTDMTALTSEECHGSCKRPPGDSERRTTDLYPVRCIHPVISYRPTADTRIHPKTRLFFLTLA